MLLLYVFYLLWCVTVEANRSCDACGMLRLRNDNEIISFCHSCILVIADYTEILTLERAVESK